MTGSPMTRRGEGWLRPGRGGAVIVEFALAMPLLALLMVGLFDFGFAAYDSMQAQAAAEAGAQYAVRHPGSWDDPAFIAAIATAVRSATGISGIVATPAPSRVCGCTDGNAFAEIGCGNTCPSGSPPGHYASVSAQVQYTTVLPYPGLSNPLVFTGQAYRRLN